MGMFTVIPQDTFSSMQMDAGVILRRFDPTDIKAPEDADIVCATTGGITVSCVPTFSDMGEDVDNCPNDMKELKHLDSWACTIGFTALGTSAEAIKLALGAADIAGGGTKIVPRRDLLQTDFSDLWWVGDKTDGGVVAVRLINALATAGFSLKTTKNGKGNITVELRGHVSINAQNVMPMEFYSFEGDTETTPSITLSDHSAKLEVGDTKVLGVTVFPTNATVTWTSGGSSVATVAGGTVEAAGTGNTIITASITVDGVTFTDTCTVIVEAE